MRSLGTVVESSPVTHRRLGAVRSTNTRPELLVRSLLHSMGYRFRLHRKDLPGKPDVTLPKHRTVVFVHGCFWHRHDGCPLAPVPKRNKDYWNLKFRRNRERDKAAYEALRREGWRVVVVWECETKEPACLAQRLDDEISGGHR